MPKGPGAVELQVRLCQMKGFGDVTERFVESLPTSHLEPETEDLVLDFICEIWDVVYGGTICIRC